MSRMAFENSSFRRNPRFSVSAIAHICILLDLHSLMNCCDVTYLAQDILRELRLEEECNSNLACNDAIALCVGLFEEDIEESFFFSREVGYGRFACVIWSLVS